MKKWIAVPNEKIGDIVFGMTREEVRALFDNKYSEFKKTSFSENSTDDFGEFHVYYDKNEKCEAVWMLIFEEVYDMMYIPLTEPHLHGLETVF